MTRSWSIPITCLTLAVALAVAGCRKEPTGSAAGDPEPDVPLAAQAEAIADLPDSSYAPPEDGRLTAAQIEMYLDVKRAAAGRDGDRVAAALRTAHEQGHNPSEYSWVESQIVNAQIAMSSQALHDEMAEGRAEYLATLEAQQAAAADAAAKAEIGRRLERFKGDAAASAPRISAAARHNAELVAGYQEQLAAVQTPEEKFTTGTGPEERPVEPPADEAAEGQE